MVAGNASESSLFSKQTLENGKAVGNFSRVQLVPLPSLDSHSVPHGFYVSHEEKTAQVSRL